jgi:hypothetical protein
MAHSLRVSLSEVIALAETAFYNMTARCTLTFEDAGVDAGADWEAADELHALADLKAADVDMEDVADFDLAHPAGSM